MGKIHWNPFSGKTGLVPALGLTAAILLSVTGTYSDTKVPAEEHMIVCKSNLLPENCSSSAYDIIGEEIKKGSIAPKSGVDDLLESILCGKPETAKTEPDAVKLVNAPVFCYHAPVTSQSSSEVLKRCDSFSVDNTHIREWLNKNKTFGVICIDNGKDKGYWGTNVATQQEIDNSPELKKINDYFINTWQFFFVKLHYDSYDNAHAALHVHYPYVEIIPEDGSLFPNACSWGRYDKKTGTYIPVFAFSYGKGKQMTVTHEFTHKVTSHNTTVVIEGIKFTLPYVCESGAINEGFSDVFAALHYSSLFPDQPVKTRWLTSTSRLICDPWHFRKPAKYRDKYWVTLPEGKNPDVNNDYGGVHQNSTVFTRVAYLLCEGQSADPSRGWSKVNAIGPDKTTKLFWHLLTKKIDYTQTFGDLAKKLHASAVDCGFSVGEIQSVIDACKETALPGADQLKADTTIIRHSRFALKNCDPDFALIAQNRLKTKADFYALFKQKNHGSVQVTPELHNKGRIYRDFQRINGIPVYGSLMSVRTDNRGSITYINTVLSKNKADFSVRKTAFPEELRRKICGTGSSCTLSAPQDMIFDPQILNESGKAALVWVTDLSVNGIPVKRYFIDQKTRAIVRTVPFNPPTDPENRK